MNPQDLVGKKKYLIYLESDEYRFYPKWKLVKAKIESVNIQEDGVYYELDVRPYGKTASPEELFDTVEEAKSYAIKQVETQKAEEIAAINKL